MCLIFFNNNQKDSALHRCVYVTFGSYPASSTQDKVEQSVPVMTPCISGCLVLDVVWLLSLKAVTATAHTVRLCLFLLTHSLCRTIVKVCQHYSNLSAFSIMKYVCFAFAIA